MVFKYLDLGDVDDDPMNSDWAKQRWDIPAKNAKELLAFLERHKITLEHFMTLPVYKLNVGKMPWLQDLASGKPGHVL